MRRFLSLSFLLIFATTVFIGCCGYRYSSKDSVVAGYNTISIPYVEGDSSGYFTDNLVRAVTVNNGLLYLKDGGELELDVKVLGYSNENIGFRHKLDDDGSYAQEIIQSESRVTIRAEFVLRDIGQDCIVLGPQLVKASVDYDYDIDSNRSNQLDFSLGQLDTNDAAFDAVKNPLNKRLSQEIADYINNSW